MKYARTAVPAFVIAASLGCLLAAVPGPQQTWNSPGSRNEDAVLRYLRPALNSAGKSGRLYYRGTCKDKGWDPIQFPPVNVSPPPRDKTGLIAIKDMFRNDRGVEVTEEQPGLVRVTIGQVSHSIMETNLSILNLKPMEQYNAAEAINAIENTNDMIEAMHRRQIAAVPIFLGLEVPPTEGEPHLPASISSLTVDQVLDRIASTFRGIVVYGECPQTGAAQRFYIGFAGLIGFDNPTHSTVRLDPTATVAKRH